MATNFFWIGYHFEEFSSQVDIRKKINFTHWYWFSFPSSLSASVEIIFCWVWLIISVWESELKLKEMTVNYFALRHHQSVEEYTCENNESEKQYTRITWTSLISSLEVAWYYCLPQGSTSSDEREKSKGKVIFNLCLNFFFFFFSFFPLAFLVSWLTSDWKYTASFWDFFLI